MPHITRIGQWRHFNISIISAIEWESLCLRYFVHNVHSCTCMHINILMPAPVCLVVHVYSMATLRTLIFISDVIDAKENVRSYALHK